MHQVGGLMGEWVRSVRVDESDLKDVPAELHPFGTPVESLGILSSPLEFDKPVNRAQLENMIIKYSGNYDGIMMPGGYDHLIEPLQMIIADQMSENPLFRHARVEFTYRHNPTPQTPSRIVHADPSRTQNAVVEDYIYFLSNKQGTIAQAQHVKKPEDTLNRMTPEEMVEQGLMTQAKPYEMLKGRQSTFHTQGAAVYEGGRTFIRVIVTHPDIDYFRNLPENEKAALPQDFREKHGIATASRDFDLH